MSLVGICRYGSDNYYLFVAEDEPKPGLLTNVSFFHMSNETYGMAFKSQYPKANLIREDRVLALDEISSFYGNDLIRTYGIPKEVYDDIFDHSRDYEKLLEFFRRQLDEGKTYRLFEWEPRQTPAAEGQIDREFEELKARHRSPERVEDVEYDRALDAAYSAGFGGIVVNGRPRAVGSIIPIELV